MILYVFVWLVNGFALHILEHMHHFVRDIWIFQLLPREHWVRMITNRNREGLESLQMMMLNSWRSKPWAHGFLCILGKPTREGESFNHSIADSDLFSTSILQNTQNYWNKNKRLNWSDDQMKVLRSDSSWMQELYLNVTGQVAPEMQTLRGRHVKLVTKPE